MMPRQGAKTKQGFEVRAFLDKVAKSDRNFQLELELSYDLVN